jgi:cysteine desulfurase
MLLSLDMKGVAASSGSACTSKSLKVSHVLLAMGLDHATAQGSLIFSLPNGADAEGVERVLEALPPAVERLRAMSPLYTEYLKGKG